MGGDGADTTAETRTPGRKEAAATALFVAPIAFLDEAVFPIGYRLQRVRPNGAGKNAFWKIVDRHVNACENQVINSITVWLTGLLFPAFLLVPGLGLKLAALAGLERPGPGTGSDQGG